MSRVAANPEFSKLMGRLLGEGLMPALAQKHFGAVASRFTAALANSLPHLAAVELNWRIHFMIGAMAHMLCAKPEGAAVLAGAEGQRVLRRLVAFLCAGLRAPSTEELQIEVE